MKKITRLLVLAFFALVLSVRANLLKDTAFTEKGAWRVSAAPYVSVDEEGVLSLTATKQERTYVQQMDTPLVEGLEYLFTVEYRSDSNTKGYFYLEKCDPWHGQGTTVVGTSEWQTASFRFKAQNKQGKYYAVLSTNPGEMGILQYRNPELVLLDESIATYKADATNVLKNPAFGNDGQDWGRSVDGDVTVQSDGVVRMSGSPNGRAYILQHNLEFVTGGRYIFTVFYRGTPGTKAQLYIERSNPGHTVLGDLAVTDEWQLGTLVFTPNPGVNPYYAVLSIPKGEEGDVEFKQPVIEFQAGELINGDFQTMATGWNFTNTAIYGHCDEKYGLSAELDSRDGNAATIRQDGLSVKQGKIYRLAYDVRGGSDKTYTDIQGATWSRIAVLDNQGQILPECTVWRDCFSTWQHKEVTFVAAQDMYVSLLGELKEPGVVYFDNIVFGETQSELPMLEIVLDAPYSYHNGVIEGDGATQFTGAVYSALRGQELVVSFGNEEVRLPGDKTAPQRFAFAVPQTQGKTPITAILLDEKGEKMAEAALVFSVRPQPPRSFTFDKDNVFYIDGKPVFPVMSWGNIGDMSVPEAMKVQSEMGFNLMLCTNHTIEYAAENGMMAMVQMPHILFNESDDQKIAKSLQSTAEEFIPLKEHPSLVAWFLVDEPAWRGEPVNKFHMGYRRLFEMIDDTRPVFLNEAPRGTVENIRPYSLDCDVYGCDIYPIPGPNSHSELDDKMASSVGKYTEICKAVVRGQKPLWMTLQGFAWGAFNHTTEAIYPTLQESRFMAFDSFAHGATGLVYWGLNLGSEQNDAFLKDLSTNIHEVLSVSAILIAPNATEGVPTASKKELLVCKKSNGAGTIWFVLNETGKACKATITGSDFPAKLQVLGEDRTVAVQDGAFRDEFPAYSVHVYYDAEAVLPEPLRMPETHRLTERVNLPRNYQKANWIWYPGLEETDDSQAVFRVPLKLDKAVEHAVLQVAADDAFVCYVNGKEVMRQKDWSCVWTYDIAQFLQEGDNEILLHAVDLGKAPCGILFSLALPDGRVILSDGAIECSNPNASAKKWVPVKVLAPFGAAPWVLPEAIQYRIPTRELLPM